MPKYKSNNIILLPKYVDVDSMDSFTLISLANFKVKIIAKILAGMLAIFMPTLISK